MTPPAPVRGPAFAAAIASAAKVAARSPSSHNCQPWGLAALTSPQARAAAGAGPGEPGGRQYLALALDGNQSLRALPAHAVEMVLSCGMYWELLTSALGALGWPVTPTWQAEAATEPAPGPALADPGLSLPGGWPRAWTPLAVGAAERGPSDPAAFASLSRVAAHRRTNRGGYRPDATSALALLHRDQEAGGEEARRVVRVTHLQDEADRAVVAGLVARFGGRDFAHPGAWRETHSFIRRDSAEAARHGDGFTLEQLLGPLPPVKRLLARAALAPGTMRALSMTGYPGLLAARLAQSVARSPGLVVIATDDPAPGTGGLLRAGAAIARYWLAATRHGLALHPVSVVLQHDDVRQRLQSAFGLPGRAVFLARVGEPLAPVPLTPRRPPAASWRIV